MEFYQELLLTAIVSLLLAFLLGKIAAPTAAGDDASVPALAGAVLKRSRTAEKRVRFREPAVEECEELLPKDRGSDAVKSKVAIGDEFGKENTKVAIGDEFGKENTKVAIGDEFGKENTKVAIGDEFGKENTKVAIGDEFGKENTKVAVGDEFGKENMLSTASTEVSLVNDARLEVNLSDVACELNIEPESRDSVNEGGLEGGSVIELQEMEIEEAVVTKMEVVESVEFDIEAGSRVGDGSNELEGESVIKTQEIVVTGEVDATVEMLVSAEPDFNVESRDWDVNQVNEAGLEGEMVVESGSVSEVESGDRDASQGNESVVSELLGGPESSTTASEQSIEFGDASQVKAAGLGGELVIGSPATLETTEIDAESARDAVKEEIIELPKSSDVVYELDIEKNGIPVVSQLKEAGLELEIKNVNAESATCVAEREETIIIRSPDSGGVEESDGVEESGGVESVESLLHGEDEWEGIQRSDVEKLFGVAASYTNSTSGVEAVSRLSSDGQMELYGLHKVATEGPCYEPQPLALMVTARAKWHAWQRLGSMNPEVAMEQYISLLTRNVPEWMGAKPGGNINQEVDGTRMPDSGPSLYSEQSSIIERESEDHIGVDISSAIPTLSGQDSA